MWRVLLAIAVLAISEPTLAQQRMVTITGAGDKLCVDFMNASLGRAFGHYGVATVGGQQMSSENSNYQEWALGFVVSSEVYTEKRISGVSLPARLDAELRNYCAANPSQKFLFAVMDFVRRNAQ